MYSTTSMLRTIELILGLKPMSQFDAAATPMFQSFQAQPDLRPCDALPAMANLEKKNNRTAWGANLKINFAREDAADPFLLNEVLWKSVRGADSTMPKPVHAPFVFGHKDDDDCDPSRDERHVLLREPADAPGRVCHLQPGRYPVSRLSIPRHRALVAILCHVTTSTAP
jgi:hypothetical protein